MKGRFVILISLVIIFGACTKKDEHKNQAAPNQLIVKAKDAEGIYISDWKPASILTSIEKEKSASTTKSFEIPIANSLQQDVVLVFARNIWENNAELKDLGGDQPLQMPFKFLPYFEQPGYVEDWNYVVQENKIDVVLTTNRDATLRPADKKVELQFLVIPSELVAQKLQTKQALKQMSYEEVLKTFDINS